MTMKMIRAFCIGVLLAVAAPLSAFAQCSGNAPANTYCGNPTPSLALPGWKPFSGIPVDLDVGSTTISSGTSGGLLFNNAGVLGNTVAPTAQGQIIRSGAGAVPAWSTSTWPSTTTINQLLYSSAANTVSGLATANNSVLTTNGSGVPSWASAALFYNGNVTYVDSGVGACTATGDGVTDDAPAIRACAAQVNTAGGGAVAFSCNKTYLLSSKSSSGSGIAILHPYSSVTYQGCGDSSVLKVGNSMNQPGSQFMVIYPPNGTNTYTYNNFAVRNLKFDLNGVNNAANAQQNVAVGVVFGSNITIDNVTMVNNPGSQYITLGENATVSVANAVINNVRFGDACTLIAGSPCTDHSSIYVVASNYTLSNISCKFSTPSAQGTCFEMHGYNGTAVGVQVENYEKVTNIAAQLSHTAANITVTGVNAFGTLYGVTLWCDGTAPMTNIVINGNTWRQRAIASTLGYFDFADAVTATSCVNGVTLSNNLYHWDGTSTAATTPTIKVGRGQNVSINNNTIVGSNGPCIGNGTVAAETSFKIENNTLIDCGQTSTAASQRGILLSSGTTITNATIRGNKIQNVASSYMSTCMAVTLNASTASWVYPDNVMVCGTQSSLTLTGSFFTQNSGGVMFIQNAAGVPGSTTGLTGAMLQTDPSTGIPALSRTPVLGVAGSAVGSIGFRNLTSGSQTIQPATGALGSGVATLPAGTYNIVGDSLTQTLTGKTLSAAVASGVWTASGTWTLPAITLGGAVSGGGQNLSNLGSIAATSTISTTGSVLGVGNASDTGATISRIYLFGGSAANGGAQFVFAKNGVTKTFFGTESSILGGGSTSDNFLIQMFGGFGSALRIDYTTGALSSLSTTAATSASTGGIVGSGGIGIAGAGWFGTYVATGVVAVGSLPACGAGIKGARMFVNNATATTFASTVAGGGANNVPVVCDGTNWIIGANDNVPFADRRKFA